RPAPASAAGSSRPSASKWHAGRRRRLSSSARAARAGRARRAAGPGLRQAASRTGAEPWGMAPRLPWPEPITPRRSLLQCVQGERDPPAAVRVVARRCRLADGARMASVRDLAQEAAERRAERRVAVAERAQSPFLDHRREAAVGAAEHGVALV